MDTSLKPSRHSLCLAVLGGVEDARGLQLDGDAALPLEVHVVEELRLHVALGDRLGGLEQSVRQRGLAVVDVCDDGEVADLARVVRPARRLGQGCVRGGRRVQPRRGKARWRAGKPRSDARQGAGEEQTDSHGGAFLRPTCHCGGSMGTTVQGRLRLLLLLLLLPAE
jgi:hypothetical protein